MTDFTFKVGDRVAFNHAFMTFIGHPGANPADVATHRDARGTVLAVNPNMNVGNGSQLIDVQWDAPQAAALGHISTVLDANLDLADVGDEVEAAPAVTPKDAVRLVAAKNVKQFPEWQVPINEDADARCAILDLDAAWDALRISARCSTATMTALKAAIDAAAADVRGMRHDLEDRIARDLEPMVDLG